MVAKFYFFTVETSQLMTKMFLQGNMSDVALEVAKNSILFRLPYSAESVYGSLIPHLLEKGELDNAVSVFQLILDGKLMGFEKADVHDFYKFFSLLNLEDEAHTAKIMELYEKMPKPTVPLVGFHSNLFIERLVKLYEVLSTAAEKSGKDLEKVNEEKTKYTKYASVQVDSKQNMSAQ